MNLMIPECFHVNRNMAVHSPSTRRPGKQEPICFVAALLTSCGHGPTYKGDTDHTVGSFYTHWHQSYSPCSCLAKACLSHGVVVCLQVSVDSSHFGQTTRAPPSALHTQGAAHNVLQVLLLNGIRRCPAATLASIKFLRLCHQEGHRCPLSSSGCSRGFRISFCYF